MMLCFQILMVISDCNHCHICPKVCQKLGKHVKERSTLSCQKRKPELKYFACKLFNKIFFKILLSLETNTDINSNPQDLGLTMFIYLD